MERGPAEEMPPMEPGRPGRQRAPDCIRRQKRRELDARRSKCRIRIGGHLERWCRLKEQLGFALHSQLAQFLLDSCKRRARPCDEDVAQIGPKRIRKAAKREILLCDFEGCGKIFSNRQYLNHHKKYQHVHQKTFTCSEPSCGKSFNFKKHLKEHEKLHSDKRDYICEFCARSFRTSSNLIIHRRIHTGEKPLQCEICGFTCRQKASLNWHMKKHDADSFYQFSCNICGKKFEKKDNVTAHKSKSHPEVPGGTPQTEGGQQQTAPSPPLNFSAGMREHPEAPGTLAVEPLEMPGLGDTLASGGPTEQIPSAEYRGGIGQDPDAPRGRVMDGIGS